MQDTRARFTAAMLKPRQEIKAAFLQAVQDIKDSVSVAEVTRALENGNIQGALDILGIGDAAFYPLRDALEAAYGTGGRYFETVLPKRHEGKRLVFRFDMRNPRAEDWLRTRSSTLITEIVEGQMEMARATLFEGMMQGRNPRSVALDLVGRIAKGSNRRAGGFIGLTGREAGAVANYRERLIADGRDVAQIDRMATKYASKLLRVRGERIARTESLASLNAGKLEAAQQAIDAHKIKGVTKVWDATMDERTRNSHRAMDGQVKKMNEPFQAPSGALLKHPGDTTMGAGPEETIHCRCYMKVRVDHLAGIK